MSRFYFGSRSRANLGQCHPDLVMVAQYVMNLQVYDFTIICGYRDEEEQTHAFLQGNSTVRWPDSNHNNVPSDAFDFGPWVRMPGGKMGIPWEDIHAFAILAGMFIAAGAVLGTPVRCGGDWDSDGWTKDHKLLDLGHIERIRT